MPGHGMNNFYLENTREIRGNPTRFQIVEIPNRRTSDRPFFDDLEALVYWIMFHFWKIGLQRNCWQLDDYDVQLQSFNSLNSFVFIKPTERMNYSVLFAANLGWIVVYKRFRYFHQFLNTPRPPNRRLLNRRNSKIVGPIFAQKVLENTCFMTFATKFQKGKT